MRRFFHLPYLRAGNKLALMKTVKSYFGRILEFFRFRRNSKYVRHYLDESNLRSGTLMSLVIIALEVWLIIRQRQKYIIPQVQDGANYFESLFSNTSNFWLFLLVGINMFAFCFLALHKMKSPKARLIITLISAAILVGYSFLLFKEPFRGWDVPKNIFSNVFLILLYFFAFLLGLSVAGYNLYVYLRHKESDRLGMITITLFASGNACAAAAADAVDVMTGMPWELRMPRIIGVRLTGALKGWATPKDVILKLTGLLTVKGGTNAIIEYFGPGTENLSCTGKATICNMGAEVGATSSVFPFGVHIAEFLAATGRRQVAAMASSVCAELRADDAVLAHPEKYYDEVVQIDLSSLEPFVNGPFTPDAACPLSGMKDRQARERFPHRVEVSLIGSCTNSSYEDLASAASVARGALDAGLKPKAKLLVIPGSTPAVWAASTSTGKP